MSRQRAAERRRRARRGWLATEHAHKAQIAFLAEQVDTLHLLGYLYHSLSRQRAAERRRHVAWLAGWATRKRGADGSSFLLNRQTPSPSSRADGGLAPPLPRVDGVAIGRTNTNARQHRRRCRAGNNKTGHRATRTYLATAQPSPSSLDRRARATAAACLAPPRARANRGTSRPQVDARAPLPLAPSPAPAQHLCAPPPHRTSVGLTRYLLQRAAALLHVSNIM